MIIGLALEVLRKQSNCWDRITECSANCEECECHVDASDLVEAVKTVLDNFPTQMSETSGRDISVITNDSSAINIKLPKFKPGSKFLLEIGEKRIGLDEYEIVGTDLYVWGSLLEKLTPYEPDEDVEFWKRRAKDYENMVSDLVFKMTKGVKFNCMEMNAEGVTFRERKPPVQAEQKWIPCSKRMPNKPGMYTVTDSKGDVVRFVFDDTESSREYWKRCAKAWMPLPEPYRGDTE